MNLELVELDPAPDLSAVVAVSGVPRLAEMLQSYRADLDGLGRRYELICVTDGAEETTLAGLLQLEQDWPELVVLGQRPWSDDDAALQVAVRRARASEILTLPGWPEVNSSDLMTLCAALPGNDLVIASRSGQARSGWKGARKSVFHWVLKRLFGTAVQDPFCRVRLARKSVMEDASALGVRQHFIPSIAAQRGYKLAEVAIEPAPAAEAEHSRFVFKPLGHLRALLDALVLYVVLKFLRRPMRFFGAIGMPILLLGLVVTATLVGFRLFADAPLADRPALIFAVMMIVLGIQIVGLGLVGEIIIFAQSRRMKQYAVKSILRQSEEAIARKMQETVTPQRAEED